MCNKDTLILHLMTPLKVKKATNNVLILHSHRPQRNFVTLPFPLDLLGHEGCNKAYTMFMTFNYPEKRLAGSDLSCSNFFVKNDIIKPHVFPSAHIFYFPDIHFRRLHVCHQMFLNSADRLLDTKPRPIILSLFQTAFSSANSLCSQALSRDK